MTYLKEQFQQNWNLNALFPMLAWNLRLKFKAIFHKNWTRMKNTYFSLFFFWFLMKSNTKNLGVSKEKHSKHKNERVTGRQGDGEERYQINVIYIILFYSQNISYFDFDFGPNFIFKTIKSVAKSPPHKTHIYLNYLLIN